MREVEKDRSASFSYTRLGRPQGPPPSPSRLSAASRTTSNLAPSRSVASLSGPALHLHRQHAPPRPAPRRPPAEHAAVLAPAVSATQAPPHALCSPPRPRVRRPSPAPSLARTRPSRAPHNTP